VTVAIAALTSVRQPYPSYKATDVPWSDVVPDHWDVQSVKYGFDVRLGKMLQNEPITPSDTLVPYLRSVNVGWDGIDTSNVKEMWFSPSDKMLYRLAPGDLVVCEGGDVGRCSIWRDQIAECYIQNAVHRVRSRSGYSNGFLYYWLSLLKGAGYIDLVCNKATIAHLTVEKLRALPLFCPPQVEQQAITTFLDRETARINALIAKKERLIEVLGEKRTVLINQAVTKGLDSTASMKDSGVEWLGQVPRHWRVMRVKFVAKLHRGYDLPEYERVEGTYPVVTSGGIVGTHDRYMTKGPGVVTGRYGSTGRIFYVEPDYWPHNTALYVCDFYGNSPRFVYYLMHTLTYDAFSNKSAVPGIDRNDLHEIMVAVPSRSEQETIVDYIDRQTIRLDALVGKAYSHIDKLREHRTALITAAVTGKIDVREDTPRW